MASVPPWLILKVTSAVWNVSDSHTLGNIACINYDMFTDMNWKVNVACNFNWCIETEGLLKVTGSHVHREIGNISEMVQDGDVLTAENANRMWHMAYRTAAILMTFMAYCELFQTGFFVQQLRSFQLTYTRTAYMRISGDRWSLVLLCQTLQYKLRSYSQPASQESVTLYAHHQYTLTYCVNYDYRSDIYGIYEMKPTVWHITINVIPC